MNCNYSTIGDFGPGAGLAPQNDPLTYCVLTGVESEFQHLLGGGLLGPNSGQCQKFMAQYCATKGWDGICEYKSNDANTRYPNMVSSCNGPNGSCMGPGIGNAMTSGQMLIRNTAAEKYIVAMSGNCRRVYEPFDPTVADSPLLSSWVPDGKSCMGSGHCNNSPNACVPIYDVDAKTIDMDPVMNKILMQPWIAQDILGNIFQNRKRTGRLAELANTKLGRYFSQQGFQNVVQSRIYRV